MLRARSSYKRRDERPALCRTARMNPSCRQDPLEKSNLIYAGCNGNANGKNESFTGDLFCKHECSFCQEVEYCALLHVCDGLRLDHKYDRMCIDCAVRGMCTGKNGNRETYCPTRNHTPLVTAIIGISILDEIQKIIVVAFSLLEDDYSGWTYEFEFEKRINLTLQRTDLVITIRYDNEAMWYILGMCILDYTISLWRMT